MSRSRVRRTVFLFGLIVPLLTGSLIPAAQRSSAGQLPADSIEVVFNEGKLSVTGGKPSLRALLQEITKRTEVRISFGIKSDHAIPELRIDGVDLETALRQIVEQAGLTNANWRYRQAAFGSVLKFGDACALGVIGNLNAEGTANRKIVFTSVKDDSVSGDTNGDGNGSQPGQRNWNGIVFNAGSAGSIRHAVVRYGGYDTGGGAAILVITGSGQPALENLTFTDNYTALRIAGTGTNPAVSGDVFNRNSNGISVEAGASPTIAASTFDSNLVAIGLLSGTSLVSRNRITRNGIGVNVSVNSGAAPHINFNNIYSNTTYGVLNADCPDSGTCGKPDVDASNNYWGSATGPSGAGPGTGDRVSFHVVFLPFRTETALDAPTITSISPSTGGNGRVVFATLTGTDLWNATAITFSGTGMTAAILDSGLVSLPIQITIAGDAARTARTLTVTTAEGTSAPFSGFSIVGGARGQVTSQ